MELTDIIFYIFALVTVGSAMIVVFSRNLVYSAFSLMFTFLGIAGLYVLLLADFLAVTQLMIYVGGILVLMIFGVMLTHRVVNVEISSGAMRVIPATIVVGVFLGTLLLVLTRTNWMVMEKSPDIIGTTSMIGTALVTDYLLPFEVGGVVLLVAIVAAAFMARKR
ncbi:MAG: NADH-quinone oxidoreductase subunit J [Chlorobi bacterium]|nr:NADH-quinone oxidoreductase subunit J [Chlorobiota bacterium]